MIVNGRNTTSYKSTIPNRYVCIDYISGSSFGAGLRILPYPTQSPAFLISQKTAPKSRFLPASPRGKRFGANFHIPCKKIPRFRRTGGFQIDKEPGSGKNGRGEPCSPAEKQRFSDFPKENNRIFRLSATDFAWAKSTGDRGSPLRVLFRQAQIPRFRRTGGFISNCIVPIRRAEASDQSSEPKGCYSTASASERIGCQPC